MIIRDLEHLEVVTESPESTKVKGAVGPFGQFFANVGFQGAGAGTVGANSNAIATNVLFQNGVIQGLNG